ncbi:Crp/Fnr family transcriptional regulator [Phenylobacterium sp.]|uniref:Crp/Fnr family transcriptional regulator n=1 Tax=Phenylobacterium sp. TaxID=1871053 RepID=UPI00286DDEF6|nr:Crp/Fnr family transcriptional regulator [Phenylobacterium sp.]
MSPRERAAELLTRAVWLQGHGPPMIEALLTHGRIVHLPTGAWAQSEGDEQTGITLVVEGAVQMMCAAPGGREVLFGQAGPGVALGQTLRFGGGPRLVTLICVEPSVLLVVPDHALTRIAADRPEVWQAVAALVYLQLRGALMIAAEAVALPPRQRLAARLDIMARTGGRSLRMNQQALAEMLGLSRKTVNFYLAGFQRGGLLTLGYGHIEVRDTAGLRRIAES